MTLFSYYVCLVRGRSNNWKAYEASRPNTIYNFTSNNGKGFESCNLGVQSLDIPDDYEVSQTEIEELFSAAGFQALLPSNSRYIDGSKTKIDGESAGVVNYFTLSETANIKMIAVLSSYYVYYNKKLIVLTCAVADKTTVSPEVVKKRFNEHKPLFALIANSLVIKNKWK